MISDRTVLNAVYYVDSPDMEVGHIAIRPTFTSQKAMWEDTSTGMIVHLAKSTFNKDKYDVSATLQERIELVSRSGDSFSLEIMTLELYNDKVRNNAVGKPTFFTTQELQQYYLSTDFLKIS